MSRIGKQTIAIPKGVSVSQEGGVVTVSGPKGTLSRPLKKEVEVTINEEAVTCAPTNDSIFARALWGTYASHIINMIAGVTGGFDKKLVIEGIGYKAQVSGDMLVLNVGFSHPVEMKIPEGITVSVEKNNITVSGIDKEQVGLFAARVRAKKKPEPYKGKGIRYENEEVKRKQGKKAAT